MKKYLLILGLWCCFLSVHGQSGPPPLFQCDSMATAFTPNGDGNNDSLRLGPVLSPYEMPDSLDWRIFNRWGQEVFRSRQPGAAWDGKDPKKKNCEPGIYPYLITGIDRFGTRHQCKGVVMVVR